ncbi:MAG: DUF3638 domain-containing protein [Chlamydiales bacterium]|nr:DUF3638 domain-containing protein [Chlamydiales bacterium]
MNHLATKINKIRDDKLTDISEEIEKIRIKIKDCESNLKTFQIPKIRDTAVSQEWDLSFPSDDLYDLSRISIIPDKKQSQVESKKLVLHSPLAEDAGKVADEWVAYIEDLIIHEDFLSADRAICSLMRKFADKKLRADFIQKLPEKEILAWLERFDTLSSRMVSIHFALDRPCLPHTRILYLLRNFDIMQQLLKRDPGAKFKNSHFNFEWLVIGLKDPYLDLGSSGPEIVEISQRLLDLNLDPSERQGEFIIDEGFITDPSSGFKLTQNAFRLLTLAIMPSYCLSDSMSFSPFSPGYYKNPPTRDKYLEDQACVRNKMKNCFGNIAFVKRESKEFLLLSPFGIRFYSPLNGVYLNNIYQDEISGCVSSYRNQRKLIKRDAIRKRLIEGVVGVHHAGASEKGSNANYREFRYQGQYDTPASIQEEKISNLFGPLSPDACKKLQLLQTAPEDRVRNTLYFFAENPSLLEDSDFQRLFELNWFRYGYLHQKLLHDPSFVSDLSSHLKIFYHKILDQKISLGFAAQFLSKVVANLPQSNEEIEQLYSQSIKELDKRLLEQEKQFEKNNTLSVAYREEAHRWLLAVASNSKVELSDDEMLGFFRRYFCLSSIPRKGEEEDDWVTIRDKIDLLMPRLSAYLEKNREGLTKIVELKAPNIEHSHFQPDPTGTLWSNNQSVIDLPNGTLYQVNQKKSPLPLEVCRKVQNLVSPVILRADYLASRRKIGGEIYQKVEIQEKRQGKNRELRIFFSNSADRKIIIFMREDEGKWYQKVDLPHDQRKKLPFALRSLDCWANIEDKEWLFKDPAGNSHHLRFLQQSTQTQSCFFNEDRALYVKDDKDLNTFNHLAEKDEWLLMENNEAYYTQLDMRYKWDCRRGRWYSSLHRDYFLSDKNVNYFLNPLTAPTKQDTQSFLFSDVFSDYHILESEDPSQKAKLILSMREYSALWKPEDDCHIPESNKLRKYLLGWKAKRADCEVFCQKNPLLSFEIDVEKGLVSEQPEAYLYLSYLYFIQGKYPQAQLAMQNSFNRMQGVNRQIEEMISYFRKWPVKEDTAYACLGRLLLSAIEQKQAISTSLDNATTVEYQLDDALEIYLSYLERESSIDPQLRFTDQEHQRFRFLARRSCSWMNRHLSQKVDHWETWANILRNRINYSTSDEAKARFSDSLDELINRTQRKIEENPDAQKELEKYLSFKTNFEENFENLEKSLQDCFIDFEDLNFYVQNGLIGQNGEAPTFVNPQRKRERDSLLLAWGLDREIASRLSSLPRIEEPPALQIPRITNGTPIFRDYEKFLERVPKDNPQNSALTEYLDQLQQVFPKDSFEAQMAKELAEDVDEYCRSIGKPLKQTKESEEKGLFIGIKEGADLKSYQEKLEEEKKAYQSKKDNSKRAVASFFSLGDSVYSLLHLIREQDPVVQDLFQQALFCFGERDWTPLLDKGVIKKDQIDELEKECRNYLINRTLFTQIDKTIKQLNKLRKNPKEWEYEGQILLKLLKQKRYYDPETHPLAPSLLLLENEAGIICDDKQIEHICDMLLNQGAFKHEAWGGGKTSVLRHMITRFHADGAHISALLTHTPLIAEHHKQLKEATACYFGQKAYRFDFTRTTPTDGIAIRFQHLMLIKAIQEKGRVDQTLNSLISASHALNLKILDLHEGSSKEEWDAIEKFSRLLSFRKERMIVGSDELDQLFTPDHQHNYSIGTPLHIQKELYEPALLMLRLLKTEPGYRDVLPYFTTKNPTDMSKEMKTSLLQRLASDLFNHYNFSDLSEEELLLYWMPLSETISQDEFNKLKELHEKFKRHDQAKSIQCIRIFLNTILPLSFETKAGVHYIRSEDGIHTKPALNSGECNELSQHGSIHLMIWYTCLDYLKNGIIKTSMKKAVERYLAQLRESAQKEQKGCEQSIDNTRVGMEFNKNFALRFSSVEESNYPEIAQILDENIHLLCAFIEKANFEGATYYSKRLVGNGKQAAHEVKEVWGSSGNAERIRTLPAKVKKIPGLERQKGTMGMIFYNFAKDYCDGDEIYYNRQESFGDTVSRCWNNPGSALIDIAPFFEGMKPEEALSQVKHKLPIRFVHSNGEIQFRTPDGKSASSNCSAYMTYFSHGDRRGRNLLLPPIGTHFITISSTTNCTEFSQGGMRARGWGKGQKLKPIIDEGCKQRLEKFKNLPFPVQLFALLIQNEVAKLKKLHTLSNQEEISAISHSVVQTLLRSATDLKTLISLRDLCIKHGFIEKESEINLENLSRPHFPQDTPDFLQEVIQCEKRNLQELKMAILNLAGISDTIKRQSQKVIDQACSYLDNPGLILEKRFLTEKIDADCSHEMIETMEVEQIQDVVAEVEVDHQQIEEVQDEVEIEYQMEQEVEYDIEQEVKEPRPNSSTPMWQVKRKDVESLLIPSHTILGEQIYFTPICFKFGFGLWFTNDRLAKRQPLAPSVLLIKRGKAIHAVMGTAKDADLVFEEMAREPNCLHYKFKDQRPLKDVLKEKFAGLEKAAIKKIVASKTAYGADVDFSEEEQKILQSRKETQMAQKLKDYLNRYFPQSEQTILQYFG